MSLSKKNLLATFTLMVLMFTASKVYALPGITYYMPDTPGEYVFYNDHTFTRDSIIGFCYYDESTYAVRYYAPASSTSENPDEQDITIYVTIDPQDSNITFTGEEIVGLKGSENIDIVNYMHDLMYQLSKARRQISLPNTNLKTENIDIPDFDGKVKVTFDANMPIFNIYSINAMDGKSLMTVATTGILTSSDDKSFTTYKKIDGLPKDNNRKFNIDKKAKKTDFKYNSQSVTIDAMWNQYTENMYYIDNVATLTLVDFSIPEKALQYETEYIDMQKRRFSHSAPYIYSLYSHRKLESKGSTTKITNVYYDVLTGNVERNFRILTKVKDGTYTFMELAVADSVYQANKKYFDTILKSYKAK